MRTRFVALIALVLVPVVPAFADLPPVPSVPVLRSPAPSPRVTPSPAPTPRPTATPAPTAPARPRSSQEAAVRAMSGTGMFVWQWEKTGSVAQVVERARTHGINFLVVRASSQKQGFYLQPKLAELLPAAHARGIKVVAYDPPRFEDVEADARRAHALAAFTTKDGHRVDAVAADIEPAWERYTPQAAQAYGARLRQLVGPHYPLVGIVFPPNQFPEHRIHLGTIARHFDVLAPMAYWRAVTQNGPAFVTQSIQLSARHGKPVSVIGQAFSFDEQRNPVLRGYPPRPEFEASIAAARKAGAIGMSWWVWEHATPWSFESIRNARWAGTPGPGYGVPVPTPTPAPPKPAARPADEQGPALRILRASGGEHERVGHAGDLPLRMAAVGLIGLASMAAAVIADPRRRRELLWRTVEAAERGAAALVRLR